VRSLTRAYLDEMPPYSQLALVHSLHQHVLFAGGSLSLAMCILHISLSIPPFFSPSSLLLELSLPIPPPAPLCYIAFSHMHTCTANSPLTLASVTMSPKNSKCSASITII
jgi:hypothetical protein